MTQTALSAAIKSMGRPMTYYPNLARLIGLKESIFLCQLIYWTPRSRDDEQWIYKSVEEMEIETGLSYKEQTRIRKSLLAKMLVEEKYLRDEHRLFFRVSTSAVDKIGEHLTNGHMLKSQQASDQRSSGTCSKVSSIKSCSTEITSETTHSVDSAKAADPTEDFSLSGEPEPKQKNGHKTVDIRHHPFRQKLEKFWNWINDREIHWDAAEAGQLALFLKKWPKFTIEQLHEALINYADSENVVKTQTPKQFLPKLNLYFDGPLDQYGKPAKEERKKA